MSVRSHPSGRTAIGERAAAVPELLRSLRRACLPVCLSVRMQQFDSHRTDFREI